VLRATEDLRQEQLRSDLETEAARADVSEAQTALANERDGKGPLAIAEAEAAANDAGRDLAKARANAEDMQALLAQGFVTRVEADRAADALRQAEDRDRIATLKLSTLRNFEEAAALDKSKADLSAATRSLGGTTAAAASRLTQRQAAVALAWSRLGEARARLEHARDDVARTIIRSESAGLVVYEQLFFGTEKRKPEPGDEVWPNQPIVAVPDSSQLVVDTRVRELDLHKVVPGAPVLVTVDAYPDARLTASVELIGALAQEDAARPGAKFFPLTVRVTDKDARLRTGMTARVEIEVTTIARAVVVPVQALIERPGGRVACDVVTAGGRVTRREVDVAARTSLVAAIRAGLRSGETVRLFDPARPPDASQDRP
jgi:HlyD family secretion protein